MAEHQSKPGQRASKDGSAAMQLSDGEIAQLILASSLAATRPLQALIKFLIQERVVDGLKLKAFLEPMLAAEGLPPETRAMLAPIWKALIKEVSAASQASYPHGGSANDG